MSAVRMVAYEVLELKPPAKDFVFDNPEMVQARFERDQMRKLVNDELRRYGLLIAAKAFTHGYKTRTANIMILYGQLQGKNNLFAAREVLAEGDFKDCCVAAAKVLDALDASQIPDTRTSPNEVK